MALLTGANIGRKPFTVDLDTTGGHITCPPDRLIEIIHLGVRSDGTTASTDPVLYDCGTDTAKASDTPPANIAAAVGQGKGMIVPNQVMVFEGTQKISLKANGNTVKVTINPSRPSSAPNPDPAREGKAT